MPSNDCGSMSKDEIKKVLLEKFGWICWGCGFVPPKRFNGKRDDIYLELDHVRPQTPKKNSSGKPGSDEIYNRAILCRRCNSTKHNKPITLQQRRECNLKEDRLHLESIDALNELVDLSKTEPFAIEQILSRGKEGKLRKTLLSAFQGNARGALSVNNPE